MIVKIPTSSSGFLSRVSLLVLCSFFVHGHTFRVRNPPNAGTNQQLSKNTNMLNKIDECVVGESSGRASLEFVSLFNTSQFQDLLDKYTAVIINFDHRGLVVQKTEHRLHCKWTSELENDFETRYKDTLVDGASLYCVGVQQSWSSRDQSYNIEQTTFEDFLMKMVAEWEIEGLSERPAAFSVEFIEKIGDQATAWPLLSMSMENSVQKSATSQEVKKQFLQVDCSYHNATAVFTMPRIASSAVLCAGQGERVDVQVAEERLDPVYQLILGSVLCLFDDRFFLTIFFSLVFDIHTGRENLDVGSEESRICFDYETMPETVQPINELVSKVCHHDFLNP